MFYPEPAAGPGAPGRKGVEAMKRSDERGEGKLGLLIAVVVFSVAIFLGVKIIPVRIDAYEFRDVLRQEARFAAVRSADSKVADRIMKKAQDMELPLNKKDLTVSRTNSKVTITAKYEVPIDLKMTTYVFKFEHRESAPLF